MNYDTIVNSVKMMTFVFHHRTDADPLHEYILRHFLAKGFGNYNSLIISTPTISSSNVQFHI